VMSNRDFNIMNVIGLKQSFNLRLIPAILGVATLSACAATTSPPLPRPTAAGAPSSHTPQNYEPLTSTVATRSTLGGSVLSWPAGSTRPNSVSLTGLRDGDTGHTEISDGTYLFVYKHGTGATGPTSPISDGNGAYGTVGDNRFAGTYDYVRSYNINYGPAANRSGFTGFAGVITALSDTPIGGNASYTGEVAIDKFANSATPSTVYFNRGTSTVDVDFSAGTANVVLGSFLAYTDGNNIPIAAAAAPFDQVKGTGMTISGAQFTGGYWATFQGGNWVDVVGANPTSNSSGTFFGYDPTISAPDEVAGVFVINGDAAIITGRYVAD